MAIGAEFGADVTSSYLVADNEAKAGDILVTAGKDFVRSTTEYDLRIFGVVADSALMAFVNPDPGYKLVARTGTAKVNVTAANGAIVRGDYITSSRSPGRGEKAVVSGYVLGTAMEDLPSGEGQIPVALKVEYAEISNARTLARMLNYVTGDLFKNVRDPGQFPMIMRYLMAGVVMMTSMAFSFLSFSRSVPKAIEAIGRNPLARGAIMLSMSMSIGLVVVTVGLGLAISIVILRI